MEDQNIAMYLSTAQKTRTRNCVSKRDWNPRRLRLRCLR